MASPTKIITLIVLPLLISSPALSRDVSPRRTGSVATLDVSAALQKATQAVLSQQPFGQQEVTAPPPGDRTAARSLRLHSRDFLPLSPHKDYQSLTLARLRRDQARADAISLRVELALSGLERSDLRPTGDEATAAGFSSPVVSGSSQGSGEYFSRIGVGTPPRPLYVALDTGSDVTWVQCQPCSDCYQQSDPIFDPSASSSYSPVTCGSAPCRSLDASACRNGTCLYQVSYGDGSFTVGDFATDTVSFLDGGGSVPAVAFGCGHDNEGLFVAAAGLLGLGGGALSFPSQIQARSFSYCLPDRDSPAASTLEFGSEDAPAVTAPLLRNRRLDTFYYVGMTGISVGGEMLAIPASAFAVDAGGTGGIIVDSGTAVTRLRAEAYGEMREAFDTCYDLEGKTRVEVPTVGFHFAGGGELRLPAKNYLIPVDSAGTFCFAFAPTSSPLSIIGNVQQQGTRVAFDLENLGFTAGKC